MLCDDHQTCAELEDRKKSQALQVEELNIAMQLLAKDRDRLQQEVALSRLNLSISK